MFYGNIDCIITEFHEFLLAIKCATNQIFYCIETSLMHGSGCKAAGTLSTRDVSGGVSSARVVKLYHASTSAPPVTAPRPHRAPCCLPALAIAKCPLLTILSTVLSILSDCQFILSSHKHLCTLNM